MGVFFDRAALLAAFDAVGAAARDHGTPLVMVAEACRLFRDGQPWDTAMGDVQQAFCAAPVAEARAAMLAEERQPLDALVGGIAEYLFRRWTPDAPPFWIGDRARYLDEPWFPNGRDGPGLMEYLTFASPSESESRNVMVDDEPLRRANRSRR